MGDGAKEITKAGNDVFGRPDTTNGPESIRLMCWPHVYRNVNPQLNALQKIDKKLASDIMSDIEYLQWSSHNEETFRHSYNLLEEKYTNDDSFEDNIRHHISSFFSYFKLQWIDGPVFKFYESANPWGVMNNQGIEGQNKDIKQSHTFK